MTIIDFPAYMGAKICKAKNNVRYYLNGFYVDSEGFIVATDGHRLFCDKVKTDTTEGFIFDVKGKEPTKFSYAEISTETKNISFYTAQEVLLATLPLEIVDGRFPDWRRVARVEAGKVEAIGFTMPYLADAAKVAKFYKKDIAKFEFQDSSRGCKVHFSETAFMVIMPARVK